MDVESYNSIVEAVFNHAKNFPDKLCLTDDELEITYSGYKKQICMTMSALKELGIEKSDKVVIEASQKIGFLATELALQLMGAIFVPVERNCSFEKMLDVAVSCEAKMIISLKEHEDQTIKCITFDDFIKLVSGSVEAEYTEFPKKEDISELLFSTGTTGKEKGIIITHKNDIALAENVIYGVEMERDNVEMLPSPVNHSFGLRRYYANMLRGATVILITGVMNLKLFFENMDKYGVNSLDLVPTALSVLLKLSKDRLSEYKDVIRYVQLGAAPIMAQDKAKIKELLPSSRLYNFYGSTESGCIAVYNFNRTDEKSHCIGKPAHNAKIVIVDDDKKEIVSSSNNTGLLAANLIWSYMMK